MKIKNSNKNISLSLTLPLAMGSVALFSVLRSLQVAKFIDSQTGFFTGGDVFNLAFYALLALACVAFAVISFLSYEGAKIDLVALKDKNAGIASALLAVGMFYDFLESWYFYE